MIGLWYLIISYLCRMRRNEDLELENHQLRMLLEEAERKLEVERQEKANLLDHYNKRSERFYERNGKYKEAMVAYYENREEPLKAKIRELEKTVQKLRGSGGVQAELESSSGEDENNVDVVDLDSSSS